MSSLILITYLGIFLQINNYLSKTKRKVWITLIFCCFGQECDMYSYPTAGRCTFFTPTECRFLNVICSVAKVQITCSIPRNCPLKIYSRLFLQIMTGGQKLDSRSVSFDAQFLVPQYIEETAGTKVDSCRLI